MTKGADHCSFCGKSAAEVTQMMGRGGVNICQACATLCHEAMADEGDGSPVGSNSPLETCKTPREIVAFLDDYVIGQDDAKRTLAIAVYNHYQRLHHQGAVEISKSNVLLLGPTGSGKTLLAQSIARLLDVPFAIGDATSLTQAGYVGDDVESLIHKLVQAANGDIEKAQRGIVFVDEIDKIAAAHAGPSVSRDVSGEGVQQSLLKLIEGTLVNVPQAGGRKHPGAAMLQVDTREILFVCAGAFGPLLDKLNKPATSRRLGFIAEQSPAPGVVGEVTPEALFEFGMIPEFVGRLPIITQLDALDVHSLERILVEPKNAVVRQMQALFAMDNAELVFADGALAAIAQQAMALKTGARGARGILEKLLKTARYEVPGSTGAVVTVAPDLTVTVGYPQALAA